MVDLLPDAVFKWNYFEKEVRELFKNSSIKEIRTPIIESTDLFIRSIGEVTDVVGKEMYTFLDKGDRSCTLRPEGTASVVRAAIQSGLLQKGPQKLWYQGPMFRYERPQSGRLRQFHQLGVEYLGHNSIKSDIEIISLAWDLLQKLKCPDITLQINSLGSKDDRLNFRKSLYEWLLERKDLLDKDSLSRLDRNPLRILDSKNSDTQKLLRNAPRILDVLSSDSLIRFEKLKKGLTKMEIPYEVNQNLVRGLDYYSHTVFEFTRNSNSTICGGGRFDSLIKELGGESLSAIGWAIGIERLLDGISLVPKINHPDIYLINKGKRAEINSIYLARQIKSLNYHVEVDMSGSSFAKQFKRAYKSGSNWSIILGEDEVENNLFILKRLNDDNKDNPFEKKIKFSEWNIIKEFIVK
tara:strand:- start:4929 stop:6158 length:1230 start_codon:yes stop_codon:yes gene_type:complete